MVNNEPIIKDEEGKSYIFNYTLFKNTIDQKRSGEDVYTFLKPIISERIRIRTAVNWYKGDHAPSPKCIDDLKHMLEKMDLSEKDILIPIDGQKQVVANELKSNEAIEKQSDKIEEVNKQQINIEKTLLIKKQINEYKIPLVMIKVSLLISFGVDIKKRDLKKIINDENMYFYDDYCEKIEEINNQIIQASKGLHDIREKNNKVSSNELILLRKNIYNASLPKEWVADYLRKVKGYKIGYLDLCILLFMPGIFGLKNEFINDIKKLNLEIEKNIPNVRFPMLPEDYIKTRKGKVRGNYAIGLIFPQEGFFDACEQRRRLEKYYENRDTRLIIREGREDLPGTPSGTWEGLRNALTIIAEGRAKEVALYSVDLIENEEIRGRFEKTAEELEIKIIELKNY